MPLAMVLKTTIDDMLNSIFMKRSGSGCVRGVPSCLSSCEGGYIPIQVLKIGSSANVNH